MKTFAGEIICSFQDCHEMFHVELEFPDGEILGDPHCPKCGEVPCDLEEQIVREIFEERNQLDDQAAEIAADNLLFQ